jgi:hypothetical protein
MPVLAVEVVGDGTLSNDSKTTCKVSFFLFMFPIRPGREKVLTKVLLSKRTLETAVDVL